MQLWHQSLPVDSVSCIPCVSWPPLTAGYILRGTGAGLLAQETDGGLGLEQLCLLAGGEAVRPHAAVCAALRSQQEQLSALVVGAEGRRAAEQGWVRKHLSPGVTVHSRGMLLHTILHQVLDRSNGVLFIS